MLGKKKLMSTFVFHNVLKNSQSKFLIGTTIVRSFINMPLFPEQFTAAYFCLVGDGTKRLDYSVSRKANNSCLPSTRRNQFVNVCANGKQLKMHEG